eukprot:g2527.t1
MVKQGSCAKTLDALGIEPPNRKLLSAALRKAAENTETWTRRGLANVQFVEVRSEMMIKREHAASQGPPCLALLSPALAASVLDCGALRVHQLQLGNMQNYQYVLDNGEVAITVDAAWDIGKIRRYIEKMDLRWHPLKEGDTLPLLGDRVQIWVLDTPGHTLGGVTFWVQGDLEDACGEGLRVSELQVVMPELGMKRACYDAPPKRQDLAVVRKTNAAMKAAVARYSSGLSPLPWLRSKDEL